MSTVIGRFAPSPTGRMHLGNVFAALMSWLSVRSRGGRWILGIEDLDPQRSKIQYAQQLEEDLLWLGLDWDEGGIDGKGPAAPYMQSKRGEIYQKALEKLKATGYTYPCFCTEPILWRLKLHIRPTDELSMRARAGQSHYQARPKNR